MARILYWDDQYAIELITRELSSGGVIAGTTDTVLGLMAGLSEQGFSSLNRIKGREKKPYIVLIESKELLNKFILPRNVLHIENIIEYCWPGPATLILPARHDIPTFMRSAQGTIAMRVPAHNGLLKILRHCDGLFSTSANFAGLPVPATIQDIDPNLAKLVAYTVDDKIRHEHTLPSTILDCTNEQIRVVREGAYSIELLEKIHGSSFVLNPEPE